MVILDDIKYALGILPGNDGFDEELLTYVNSYSASLVQFGLDEFDITIDEETLWPTLANLQLQALVKQYLVIRVKLMFDPSASETITRALEGSIPELVGRIQLIIEELEAALP